jgi:SAM-dependent methyltransferase
MTPYSLLASGNHSRGWIKDFYDRAGEWWGPDPQEPGVHERRRATVERLCATGPLRVLELGAGSGYSAATLADAGHKVVAVELSPTRAAIARRLAQVPRQGTLTAVEGDFYTVGLPGPFDAVVCWETFGLGSDDDQRRLLRRIAAEWLAPGGRALIDVYNPTRPARDAGTEVRLPPLPGVPGSVEMFERCHFDARHSRWIDEWVPVAAPDKALAQSIRCYSPADLALLLEGTGLVLHHLELDGRALPTGEAAITLSTSLLEAWSYLAVLAAAADRA